MSVMAKVVRPSFTRQQQSFKIRDSLLEWVVRDNQGIYLGLKLSHVMVGKSINAFKVFMSSKFAAQAVAITSQEVEYLISALWNTNIRFLSPSSMLSDNGHERKLRTSDVSLRPE